MGSSSFFSPFDGGPLAGPLAGGDPLTVGGDPPGPAVDEDPLFRKPNADPGGFGESLGGWLPFWLFSRVGAVVPGC